VRDLEDAGARTGRARAQVAAPGDRPFELGRAVTPMRAALGIPSDGHVPTA
jgi:hypothetical protein